MVMHANITGLKEAISFNTRLSAKADIAIRNALIRVGEDMKSMASELLQEKMDENDQEYPDRIHHTGKESAPEMYIIATPTRSSGSGGRTYEVRLINYHPFAAWIEYGGTINNPGGANAKISEDGKALVQFRGGGFAYVKVPEIFAGYHILEEVNEEFQNMFEEYYEEEIANLYTRASKEREMIFSSIMEKGVQSRQTSRTVRKVKK